MAHAPQYEHPPRQDWGEYERRKQEYLRRHPDATPSEYAAALTRIARECGV